MDFSVTEPAIKRRAVDLLVPPFDKGLVSTFTTGNLTVQQLIEDINSRYSSGCLKTSNENELFRGGMLFIEGEVVGCFCHSKSDPITHSTEESLKRLLGGLKVISTEVTVYELPKDIVMAKSALFLGYPVEREDDLNGLEYFKFTFDWLAKEKGTATISSTLPDGKGMTLSYFCKGDFMGTFFPDEKKFESNLETIQQLLLTNPQSNVHVSLLPPEMLTGHMKYGVNLVEAWRSFH